MANEQWKDKGICEECRRQNYCGAKCTAYKRNIKYRLEQMLEMQKDIRTIADNMGKEEACIVN